MSAATTADKAPLDDVMLAMDVVDTLRHNQDLVARELAGEAREKQLIEKLREIYRHMIHAIKSAEQAADLIDDIIVKFY